MRHRHDISRPTDFQVLVCSVQKKAGKELGSNQGQSGRGRPLRKVALEWGHKPHRHRGEGCRRWSGQQVQRQ